MSEKEFLPEVSVFLPVSRDGKCLVLIRDDWPERLFRQLPLILDNPESGFREIYDGPLLYKLIPSALCNGEDRKIFGTFQPPGLVVEELHSA